MSDCPAQASDCTVTCSTLLPCGVAPRYALNLQVAQIRQLKSVFISYLVVSIEGEGYAVKIRWL